MPYLPPTLRELFSPSHFLYISQHLTTKIHDGNPTSQDGHQIDMSGPLQIHMAKLVAISVFQLWTSGIGPAKTIISLMHAEQTEHNPMHKCVLHTWRALNAPLPASKIVALAK